MHNPTPTKAQLNAARYSAWKRMRSETREILAGSLRSELNHDLPHVSAWLAAHARYELELKYCERRPLGRRLAHGIRLQAEAQYVEAILPEEIERAMAHSLE